MQVSAQEMQMEFLANTVGDRCEDWSLGGDEAEVVAEERVYKPPLLCWGI